MIHFTQALYFTMVLLNIIELAYKITSNDMNSIVDNLTVSPFLSNLSF